MPPKRHLPRRELPLLGNLIDKLSFSKLPTNGVVLRRLMFELETDPGHSDLSSAAVTVREELRALWEYAGYGDILQAPSYILRQIKALHSTYKSLLKTPHARRECQFYKKKESSFLSSLPNLFDITVTSLHTSNLITPADRDFLLHHWDKTISSTSDLLTKSVVEKKLAREQRTIAYRAAHTTPSSTRTCPFDDPSSSQDGPESTQADSDFTPKRRRQTGTTVTISKDILTKLGPVADRLKLSHTQVNGIVAAITNHGGGDVSNITLSKSSARRHRAAARSSTASAIKENFTCDVGQINFDGKLLPGLYGFGKFNRVAVVFVQVSNCSFVCRSFNNSGSGYWVALLGSGSILLFLTPNTAFYRRRRTRSCVFHQPTTVRERWKLWQYYRHSPTGL